MTTDCDACQKPRGAYLHKPHTCVERMPRHATIEKREGIVCPSCDTFDGGWGSTVIDGTLYHRCHVCYDLFLPPKECPHYLFHEDGGHAYCNDCGVHLGDPCEACGHLKGWFGQTCEACGQF